MASETTTTAVETSSEPVAWRGGALAGLVAGIVMGAMLTMQMGPVIEVAIPSMYGLSGLTAGWAVHLFHSVVLGIVFAGIASIASGVDSVGRSALLGLVYGVGLWVLLAAFVMPVWLGAVGSLADPPLPNFNPLSLVGHVVYGLVLGLAFPSLLRL
ncbi:histidine kinase [Halorussus lipolyticus]|uniref:histidine kinase n=1 Tax=Halorussus lipolyticus TaxID=3034024 RepID=UPI0023E8AEDF|nr:histidine kinase [Halorussus sp. DT80]